MPGTLTCLGVSIDSVGESGGTELGPAALRRILVDLPMVEAGDTHERLRGGGLRDAAGESVGLAYLDGHMDLYEGSTSPTGEGADMPVATALGRAPAALLERLGAGPTAPRLLEPDRLCLIGPRDPEEREALGDPVDWGIEWFRDRDSLRGADLAAVGSAAESHLREGGRFWLALDVDVLDERAFPATDYLMPDGLELADLETLIRPLLRSEALAGLSITCFNPEKDPDGRCSSALASLLTSNLR